MNLYLRLNVLQCHIHQSGRTIYTKDHVCQGEVKDWGEKVSNPFLAQVTIVRYSKRHGVKKDYFFTEFVEIGVHRPKS